MNIKKVIILLFCALFIGAQAFVAIVPYSFMWGENWEIKDRPFWPFMRYPMYANGKEPGDEFSFQKLRVIFKDGKRQLIYSEDIHLMGYRYKDLIWSMIMVNDSTFTPNQSDYDNYNLLSYLIKKYVSKDAEVVELWAKTYKITAKGIEDFDVGWELKLTCKIIPDSLIKVNSFLKKDK